MTEPNIEQLEAASADKIIASWCERYGVDPSTVTRTYDTDPVDGHPVIHVKIPLVVPITEINTTIKFVPRPESDEP